MTKPWTKTAVLAVAAATASGFAYPDANHDKPAPEKSMRRFTVEDYLQLADLGEARFSPDGRFLVLEEVKPYNQSTDYAVWLFSGEERTEVWLYDLQSGERSRVSVPDADGVWTGPWSPDGRYLMVKSFVGSGPIADSGVSLGIWDTQERRYKKLPGTPFIGTSLHGIDNTLPGSWASHDTLVYAVTPEGRQPPTISLLRENIIRQADLWLRSWKGKEPSYSLLESGAQFLPASLEQGRLLRVRVASGSAETLAEGDFSRLQPSPDRKLLVALKEGPWNTPVPGRPFDYEFRAHSLVLVDVSGGRPPVEISGGMDVPREGGTWSESGESVVFPARPLGDTYATVKPYTYDLHTGEVQPQKDPQSDQTRPNRDPRSLQTPSFAPPDGVLAASNKDASLLVYKIEDGQGKRFVLVDASTGEQEQFLTVNEWIREITFATKRRITYCLPDGRSLTGVVLLPPGYEPGERYPLTVNVYGGHVFLPDVSIGGPSLYRFYLNTELMASQGYVVLSPSLPLDRGQESLDMPKQLATATLAAVDKLIDEGIADPDRLAIMGHSFGGYTTAAVLTQTQRFKAAIASSGLYNLSSAQGTFVPQTRADSTAHTYLLGVAGQTSMKSQGPWKDPEGYVRNSPLFFADKITTPILFIHGEIDHVSLTQPEEMFTALFVQRKPARFLRFWGEGHGPKSPANIRQAWIEISRFLDEYLK